MSAGANRRFRLKQAGLVLLVVAMALPATVGFSNASPREGQLAGAPETPASARSEAVTLSESQNGDVAPDTDLHGEHLANSVDQAEEWATLTSDDLVHQQSDVPGEFFGMVSRDPWYEYGTNPEDHPNDINRTFLENMIAEMSEMGVRWLRFEFRAETDYSEGPGPIDWNKHDWFINELLPAYDIQPMALFGSGFIGDDDLTYQFSRINDNPDQSGRNHYTETFIDHVEQVVSRYGDRIPAYEILNEPNNNQVLSWETAGQVEEVDPVIYGRLVIDSYETIQEINPDSVVVAGALLYHRRDGVHRHFEWLERVYESTHIQTYRSQNDRYPWDVISIHPYFLSADGVVEHLHEFREFQESYNDSSPVWLTEIGYQADPPAWTSFGIMDPTVTEIAQAEFLEEIYTRLPVETPFVERVFWFKYEDFGSGTYARWGLVRLRDSNFRYGPDATPWPRKEAFAVYQSLARPEMDPRHPQPRPDDEGDRVRYFEATGQELRDPFLQYWEDYGGLAMFGYPQTKVFEVRGRKVQYFERARFEYWPENIGTPWEVQLGLLGMYETRDRTFERQPPPEENDNNNDNDNDDSNDDNGNDDENDNDNDDDDRIYFPETGQYLGGPFREYWEDLGGLEIFGFPISPEFEEENPADGETYVVQYFERARFEWHPELAGTEYEVQFGLLGNQVLEQPGWRR